jgi:glycosyltransferase involved in cell wall biosynthesis
MPPITALLHTCNDALRLGRALETLRPCDELLVIDHASSDATVHLALEYGATVRKARPGDAPSAYLSLARNQWVFCLLPSESISEGLEAALFEWTLYRDHEVAHVSACSVSLREETPEGWVEAAPVTRLVPRTWPAWGDRLPSTQSSTTLLSGYLLRFRVP